MKKLMLIITGLLFIASSVFAGFESQEPQSTVSKISATPTINTSEYTDGDLVGTKLTFRTRQNKGYIQCVNITDLADNEATPDLVIFDANPSNTTFTNNSAFDLNDSDIDNIVPGGVISFASTDYYSFNDNGLLSKNDLKIPYSTSDGILYGCLVIRENGKTYSTTSDLTVEISVMERL
jgi:hypothetical protein